jgi:hypothetical protein
MDPAADDYRRLQALLKLKRYEQPPPRYFDDLSQGVIHRLRGPEGLRQQSLLAALGLRAEWKPALFYALGVACCAVSLYGIASLVVSGPDTGIANGLPPSALGPGYVTSPSPVSPVLNREGLPEASPASTDPVLSPGGVTIPIDPLRLKVTPVRYDQK